MAGMMRQSNLLLWMQTPPSISAWRFREEVAHGPDGSNDGAEQPIPLGPDTSIDLSMEALLEEAAASKASVIECNVGKQVADDSREISMHGMVEKAAVFQRFDGKNKDTDQHPRSVDSSIEKEDLSGLVRNLMSTGCQSLMNLMRCNEFDVDLDVQGDEPFVQSKELRCNDNVQCTSPDPAVQSNPDCTTENANLN